MAEHIKQFKNPCKLKQTTPQSRRDDIRFYQSPRWRALRLTILRRDPICKICEKAISKHAHHIRPRKQYPELAFDETNLIGICVPCHLAMPER